MKRKRTIDEVRYLERIKNLINSKLPEIIAKENIIESFPEEKIRIKIPANEQPYFKPVSPHKEKEGSGSGAGLGGNKQHELELELTVEELAELLFEYLNLPKLKPKGADDVKEEFVIEGIEKVGPKSRIHRRKTYYEIVKYGLKNDSIRYKFLRKREKPVFSAVVYFARDYSASMDEYKKFKVKSTAFWINKFLKLIYPKVITKFAVHDTDAKFVSENDFFLLSEGGGTKCSSVFELISVDSSKYNISESNFYLFYFSDGENFEEDNIRLYRFIEKLSDYFNLIAYGEVKSTSGSLLYSDASLINVFRSTKRENVIAKSLFSVRDFIIEVFSDSLVEQQWR